MINEEEIKLRKELYWVYTNIIENFGRWNFSDIKRRLIELRYPISTKKGCGKEIPMFYSEMNYIVKCGEINPISEKILYCDDCKSTKNEMSKEDKIVADNLAGEDVDTHTQIKKEIDKDYE